MAASSGTHVKLKTLSFSEALDLVKKDKFSQFVEVPAAKHFVLSPKYLGRLKEGILSQLESELNVYSELLNGALIAYNNIKLKSTTGVIVNENSQIHFDIQADFIVFRPTVGCTLQGVVNRVFKQHIVCLVHSCFNASIHKPRNNAGSWDNASITVGQDITFRVSRIYNNNGVLSMKGDLVNAGISSKKQKGKFRNTAETSTDISSVRQNSSENHDSAYHTDSINNSSLDEESSSHGKKKKKKSKKEKTGKQGNSDDEESVMDCSNCDVGRKGPDLESSRKDEIDGARTESIEEAEVDISTSERTKKKKAKKRKAETSSVELSDTVLCADSFVGTESDSAGRKSKKKQKKHKKNKHHSNVSESECDVTYTSLKSKDSDVSHSVLGDRFGSEDDSAGPSKAKKKKKEKRHKMQTEQGHDESQCDTVVENDANTSSVKVKHHKKKSKGKIHVECHM